MTESNPGPGSTTETTEQPAQEAEQPKVYDEEYVRKLRDENASWRTKYRELDGQRKASMTETERAIAEAEERGRAAVRTEYGSRLAQTEFRAAAAARNPGYDATRALQHLNLTGLLDESGEPNGKAIAAAVADLIPEAAAGPAGPPSFDGGTRTTATPTADMNRLIRQAVGRA